MAKITLGLILLATYFYGLQELNTRAHEEVAQLSKLYTSTPHPVELLTNASQ
jgi:hypothetical protein